MCSSHAPPPHDKPPHSAHTRWVNFHGWRRESCCCCFLHRGSTGTELLAEKRREARMKKHVTCYLFEPVAPQLQNDKVLNAFFSQACCYRDGKTMNLNEFENSFSVLPHELRWKQSVLQGNNYFPTSTAQKKKTSVWPSDDTLVKWCTNTMATNPVGSVSQKTWIKTFTVIEQTHQRTHLIECSQNMKRLTLYPMSSEAS